MDAPDAISLGVWLQAVQEEIQAARDNALNSSCHSIQKSSPAMAHARTVEELLGTFAGNEVPGINCISYSNLPMATDANEEGVILNTSQALAASNSADGPGMQSSKEGSGSGKKAKRGMLKRMFTSSKRDLDIGASTEALTPTKLSSPIHEIREIPEENEITSENLEDEAEIHTPPTKTFERGPQQVSDDEDEDLLDATAEEHISESFSPKQRGPTTPYSPPRPPTGEVGKKQADDGQRDRSKQTANANMGLQLSVQLSGVCEAADALFIVVFGGKLSNQARTGLAVARERYVVEIKATGKAPPSLANVDLSHVDWIQLGRTEVVKQKDAGSLISRTTSKADPSSQAGGLSSNSSSALVCRQFSLMINDPGRYGVDILMFAVYKANGHSDMLNTHQELAWGVVDCDNLDPGAYSRLSLNTIASKSSSMAAFQDMNADLNLRLPSEMFQSPEPVAFLGICPTQSVGMTRRVYAVSQRLGFRTPPYCHKLYGFQALQGQVLTREELYLPRYSLSVPAAMLALLLEERLPSVEKLLNVVVEELMHATKNLKATQKAILEGSQKNVDLFIGPGSRSRTLSSDRRKGNKSSPSQLRRGSSGGALGGHTSTSGSGGKSVFDAVDDQIASASKGAEEIEKAENRVATLKRGEEVLKDVKDALITEYMGCFNNCMEALRAEEEDREMVQMEIESKGKKKKKKAKKKEKTTLMGIPQHMGGARLKRSVMKKSEIHAFMPTNMNIQLMHTERVGVAKIGDTAEDESVAEEEGEEDSEGGDRGEPQKFVGATVNTFHSAKEDSSEGQNAQRHDGSKPLDTFSSLTFGVPSAHSLSKSNGGLRRLLLSQSTDGIFRPNEEAWNERSAHMTKIQKTKDNPLKLAAYENDLSVSRAAQVCALHARGLEMTVADLQSHATGRRRNSILKLASRITNDGGEDDVKEIAARAVNEKIGGKSTGEDDEDEEVEAGGEKTKLTGEVDDWFKCAQLMHRVDIVTSQALAIAISSFQTTLALAAAGSHKHVALLPRILDVGFLVSVESLLSAYGGELCMVEDLSVAIEWLSTVTVRVVEVKNHRYSTERSYSSETNSKDIGRDDKKGYGYADGVWVRRGRRKGTAENWGRASRDSSRDIAGIKWGEIVVDIEVNYETAQAVREAAKALKVEMEREVLKGEGEEKRVWKKLARRASSPIIGTSAKFGDGEPSSPEMSDLFRKVKLDESTCSSCDPSDWGPGNDVEILACCRLTAVLFTQGINAQATLANAKMGGDASIQTSINRASMQRLKAYTASFRASLCRVGAERSSKSPNPGGGGGGGGRGGRSGILQELDR